MWVHFRWELNSSTSQAAEDPGQGNRLWLCSKSLCEILQVTQNGSSSRAQSVTALQQTQNRYETGGNGTLWSGNISHIPYQADGIQDTEKSCSLHLRGRVNISSEIILRDLGNQDVPQKSHRIRSFKIRSHFCLSRAVMTDDPPLTNLAGSSSAHTSVMNSACILTLQFTFILKQQGTHVSNFTSILLWVF